MVPCELVLYLENTESLARRRDDVYKMLAKKKDRGTYDRRLAPRAFAYLMRTAAEVYAKEIDRTGTPYYKLFPVAERERAAQEMVEKFEGWYKYDRLPWSSSSKLVNPNAPSQRRND